MKTLILIIILLSGCAFNKEENDNPRPYKYSPAFKEGWAHGCASSDSKSKFIKNLHRFDNDQSYADGWNVGNIYCSESNITIRPSLF